MTIYCAKFLRIVDKHQCTLQLDTQKLESGKIDVISQFLYAPSFDGGPQ